MLLFSRSFMIFFIYLFYLKGYKLSNCVTDSSKRLSCYRLHTFIYLIVSSTFIICFNWLLLGQSWCCLGLFLCCWDNAQGRFLKFVWIHPFSVVNSTFVLKKIMTVRVRQSICRAPPFSQMILIFLPREFINHHINVVR